MSYSERALVVRARWAAVAEVPGRGKGGAVVRTVITPCRSARNAGGDSAQRAHGPDSVGITVRM
ncbi:hypothetical protein SCA03_63350 [Streptomyces cacaoi]|uniref:Uncharacterized protein n=1 Tax=Streptomyces cacaoi TaxID=1898 RepID=A0A4Y3R895_STRCI|nr:hypothetical protein SCA03_63350 [Streptomyces cacaoi]